MVAPRPSNDCGFPGVAGQLMQIWSPAKWADRTMLSPPWVFLPRSHPGNCALSQTLLSPSLPLSLLLHSKCTAHLPSSAASQSWKYNCGEREKFKHLLLIFYSYFNIMPFSDGQHHFLLLLKTRFLRQTRPNVKTILFWVHETTDGWLDPACSDGHLWKD